MNTVFHPHPIHELSALLMDIGVAMFTTRDEQGLLQGRPMATQQVDEADGAVWFFTARSSSLVPTILHQPEVSLSYIHHGRQTYISLTGRADLVEDRELMRTLWRPSLLTWFPHGVADHDLALLRVTIEHADVWEPPAHPHTRVLGVDQPAPKHGSVIHGVHRRL